LRHEGAHLARQATRRTFFLWNALALLTQSVEPNLYVAHRKLVKALGTNAVNDVQATEDLVVGSRLRSERWANNVRQPPLQIAGQSGYRRGDWPSSSGLMKCQVLLSGLLPNLAAHILSLPSPCARRNPEIGSEPVRIRIDRSLTAFRWCRRRNCRNCQDGLL
jgi:hypothetical protein